MNKLQRLSFNYIDEFLKALPPDERLLVDQLREIIFHCMPHAKEKLSYNVPYYSLRSRVCFLWPASVPWGGIQKGVLIGFCRGQLLSDVSSLEAGNRIQVLTKTVSSTKKINREILTRFLFEAAWIKAQQKRKDQ